jgi:hypothetical protein
LDVTVDDDSARDHHRTLGSLKVWASTRCGHSGGKAAAPAADVMQQGHERTG